jgi:NAD(P)-dependent dehydrogenase (short-subunit alcohol dehydrogenase family)
MNFIVAGGRELGRLDILINNAALFDRRPDRRDHPRRLRPAVCGQCRGHAVLLQAAARR